MKTTPKNAIELLKQDHKEVEAMFKSYDNLTDRSKSSKKALADQICDALLVHTQIEEEIFYPAVREAIKDDDLMDEALVEHFSAKELIGEIKQMNADEDLFDAKVKVLSEQIEHHVEEEESEMFPKVSKSKIDLEMLCSQMMERKEEVQKLVV